ncbi:MAG: aldose 1-epimerase family protein [Lachnospiraceae bacterium]
MIYTLKNELLTVKVNEVGAELISVVRNDSGQEYMWNADERYWKRTSPVLFPVVGSLNHGTYIHEETTYQMPQHGFARDKEFSLVSQSENELWLELKEDHDTLKIYPFHFIFQSGYRLCDESLEVLWKVCNTDSGEVMYFSIGAHPGFNCPIHGEADSEGYRLQMHSDDGVLYSRINQDGLMLNTKKELELEHGNIPLTNDFFDHGVYIVEDYQADSVSLLDPKGAEYIKVEFQAPLFGIWSPEKKQAPFICIEPWYGRCDRETFEGRLKDREWGNKLAPGEVFERSYTITFR